MDSFKLFHQGSLSFVWFCTQTQTFLPYTVLLCPAVFLCHFYLFQAINPLRLPEHSLDPMLIRFHHTHDPVSVAKRVVPHGLFIIDVQVDPVKVRQLHGQPLFPVALNLFFVPLTIDDFVEAAALEPKQPPQITF